MPSSSFVTAFAEMARTRPDAPALSWGDRVISYAGLSDMVESAHQSLTTLKIGEGVPVCVPARKSPHTIALVIACVRAGKQVLLPSTALGQSALADLCAQLGCTHVLSATEDDPVIATRTGNGGRTPHPAEPGLVLTTSGSTGTPKMVVLAAEGVDRFLSWATAQFGIGPDTRVLNHAPLNFDLCLLDVWAALSVGARVELVAPDRAVDGAHLAELCADRAPAVVQAVPLFFRLVVEAAAGRVFPEVRDLIFTGDAMPPPLLDRVAAAFPNARMWNVYGCTETNDSFLHEVVPAEVAAHGVVPIGTPIDGVHALVVDESGDVLTGPGAGELVVSTPFRSRGYADPRLNDEKWHDGYFRTGDLVRRDDQGLVFLVGRNDHQVKVRGVRTNLQEVEQVVLAHPQVSEAAVIAVPDETAGTVLLAVIRRVAGSEVNSLQLRVHCAAGLPRTAIPGLIEIVDHALPRTSTGKVDRNSLRHTVDKAPRRPIPPTTEGVRHAVER